MTDGMTERTGPQPDADQPVVSQTVVDPPVVDPPASDQSGFDAIVLAGGAASRLGGVDKPLLRIGSRTLLDGVLAACAGARRTVVVGPARPVAREVAWAREQPQGAGPAAALAAGLPFCAQAYVIVLAADLPFIDESVIHSLWTAAAQPGDPSTADAVDGAVAVDDSGRSQWLTACYRRSALLARVNEFPPDQLVGLSLRRLLDGLRLARFETAAQATFDCDTWEQVAAARSRQGGPQPDQPGRTDWARAGTGTRRGKS
jgi:molybdopterin-guanine dinucleotide biosynthesis protein A